jgi:hypothetical protein
MWILYVNSRTFVKRLLKRLYIYIFILYITKQLFNIIYFRISNCRAISPKVVELCVVEKCVFSAVSVVVEPRWSLRRDFGKRAADPLSQFR